MVAPVNHLVVRVVVSPAAARVRPTLDPPSLPGIVSRVPVVAGFVHVAAARMVVLGTWSSPWVVGGVDDLLVAWSDHAAAVKRKRGRRDGGTLHATARSREFERAARHPTHRLGGAHSFFVFQEVSGSFSCKPIEKELFAENHAKRLGCGMDGSGGAWSWRQKGFGSQFG